MNTFKQTRYFQSCRGGILSRCWLGHQTCKTVGCITYIVLVQTLNHAQSIVAFYHR